MCSVIILMYNIGLETLDFSVDVIRLEYHVLETSVVSIVCGRKLYACWSYDHFMK